MAGFFAVTWMMVRQAIGVIKNALGLIAGEAALSGKVISLGRNLTIGNRLDTLLLLFSHEANHSIKLCNFRAADTSLGVAVGSETKQC